MQSRAVRCFLLIFIAALIPIYSRGALILSGPTFTPATNAPLAGMLQVTTDVNSKISVVVEDGTNIWQRDFSDVGTTHSEILLGFKPGRSNLIAVVVHDETRNVSTAAHPLVFVTPPLPADFPTSIVLQSQPSQMEPGYTLFIIENKTAHSFYITIMDNSGEVVWYCRDPRQFDFDVLQLDNGDLMITDQGNRFLEMNMLGQIVRTWPAPAGYYFDIHGGFPTDHGTILSVTDETNSVPNFPTSTASNAPLATVPVENNEAIEISYDTGALLNVWPVYEWLDPTRISYLSYDNGPYVADNEHANAILEDPTDKSIIFSIRDQNAVVKFSRDGQIKWILGPHEGWGPGFQQYLLTPVGTRFEWNYGQHAPMLTPRGTLLMYDDGNYRAMPYDPPVADSNNFSRAVEYQIDEQTMQVSQLWDSTAANEDRLYTPAVGKAQWLPQSQNVLVTYGDVNYVNGALPSSYSRYATMVRIIEYTHDAITQVVFDLSFFDYNNTNPYYQGYFMYRATWIRDLYGISQASTSIPQRGPRGRRPQWRLHPAYRAQPW